MSLGLSPMLCLWVCEYNQGLYKAESFVVTWGAKTGRLKNATAMLQNFLKKPFNRNLLFRKIDQRCKNFYRTLSIYFIDCFFILVSTQKIFICEDRTKLVVDKGC